MAIIISCMRSLLGENELNKLFRIAKTNCSSDVEERRHEECLLCVKLFAVESCSACFGKLLFAIETLKILDIILFLTILGNVFLFAFKTHFGGVWFHSCLSPPLFD